MAVRYYHLRRLNSLSKVQRPLVPRCLHSLVWSDPHLHWGHVLRWRKFKKRSAK